MHLLFTFETRNEAYDRQKKGVVGGTDKNKQEPNSLAKESLSAEYAE